MRVAVLVAAIVRFVLRGDIGQAEIDSSLAGARKKSLEGIPGILGYD